jgi:cytochrome c oxidase subunit 3
LPDALAAHAEAHGHSHGHAAHHPDLQHHFETLEQQKEASTLGMWIFIIQEVMFFGGLLAAYMLYRIWYPTAWSEGSAELNIQLGGLKHGRAHPQQLDDGSGGARGADRQAEGAGRFPDRDHCARHGVPRRQGLRVPRQVVLHHVPGLNFQLEEGQVPQIAIFLSLYFALTGLHALHMVIGFVLMSVILWMAWRKRFSPEWYTPVEMPGCTGTSWISSGSSCSRCCTSWDRAHQVQ